MGCSGLRRGTTTALAAPWRQCGDGGLDPLKLGVDIRDDKGSAHERKDSKIQPEGAEIVITDFGKIPWWHLTRHPETVTHFTAG